MEEISGWSYRSEGNHNLVIGNAERHVIRRILKAVMPLSIVGTDGVKVQPSNSNHSEELSSRNVSDIIDPDETNSAAIGLLEKEILGICRYYENVMQPLLLGYAVVPALISVSPDFVKQATSNSALQRPEERKSKSPPTYTSLVLELPDLCYLPPGLTPTDSPQHPTFAIEIKLKCGVVQLTSADGKAVCLPCAFYMHCKAHGVNNGCRAFDLPYCPLDLFSGDRKRMMFALETSLSDCRFSTNRMRLFKNGAIVQFPKQGAWTVPDFQAAVEAELAPFFSTAAGKTCCNELLRVVSDALLQPRASLHKQRVSGRRTVLSKCQLSRFHSSASASSTTSLSAAATGKQSTCDSEHGSCADQDDCVADDDELPARCVLARILDVQSLCQDSVEMVYRECYLPLMDYFSTHPDSKEQYFQYDYPLWDVHKSNNDYSDLSYDAQAVNCFLKIRDFLISKTASDCSAMITLRPMLTDSSHKNESDALFVLHDAAGTPYLCCVNVIDLDPKPLSKMPYYYEMYERCMEALSVSRECE